MSPNARAVIMENEPATMGMIFLASAKLHERRGSWLPTQLLR
jgi:hypothetical protein